MSTYVAKSTGAWDGANWDTATSVAAMHASTNITVSGATPKYSDVFTAPSLTDYATSVVVCLVNYSGSGNLTATLQEYNGASWVDKNSVTYAFSALTYNCNNQLRLGTPYLFTTLTAGYYRWKFVQTGVSIIFAASSGGTNIATISCDSRAGYPAAGDNALILSPTDTRMDITISATEACGHGDNPTVVPTYRTFTAGVYVGSYGGIKNDTALNSKLELKGHFVTARDAYREFNVSADKTITFNLEIEHSSANADFGDCIVGDPLLINDDGYEQTVFYCNYTSGDGQTGTELVGDDDMSDWSVGARIVITSTDGYNHIETKYIRTNVAGALTLSDTPGGAESGLSYTHTTAAWIVLMDSNLIFSAKDPSYGFFFKHDILTNSPEDYHIRWAVYKNPGYAAVTGRRAVQAQYAASRYLDFQYNVILDPVGDYGYWNSGSRSSEDIYGIRQHGGGYFFPSSPNKTFHECFATAQTLASFFVSNAPGVKFYNCVGNGGNSTATAGGSSFYVSSSNIEAYNCDFQSCRVNMTTLLNATARFVNCNMGNVNSPADGCYIGQYSNNFVIFDSCLFDPALNKFAGYYTDMIEGSRVAYHRFNAIDNQHFTRLAGGLVECTGSDCTDTTVHTVGSHAMKCSPDNDSAGLIFTFKSPSFVNYYGQVDMFIKKNTAMASDEVRLEVWLPQSTTPDDTVYAPSDSDWHYNAAGVEYLGTTPSYSTIKVVGLSIAAGAAFYIDDIYGGTDEVNGLDLWEDGMPSSVIVEQVGNTDAVWKKQTSLMTTAGTIGNDVAKTSDIPSASTIATQVESQLADEFNAIPTASENALAVESQLADEFASIPTAGENADAVWDEAIADHLSAGSVGKEIDDTGATVTDALKTSTFIALK